MENESIRRLDDSYKIVVLRPLLHELLRSHQILCEGGNVPGVLRLDQLTSDLVQLYDSVRTGINKLLLLLEGEGSALLFVDGDDWPEAVSSNGDGAPLGMLFGDAHPGHSLDLKLLAKPYLYYRNALVLGLIVLLVVEKVRRYDGGVVGMEVLAGDRDWHVSLALRPFRIHLVVVDIELKFHRASWASVEADTIAVGEEGDVAVATPEGIRSLEADGDEAEAVGNVLVVEDRRVLMELDKIDGQSRNLSDHYSAQGVGHTGVRVG